MKISPLGGKPAPAAMLVDVPGLVAACDADMPDPSVLAQLVGFCFMNAMMSLILPTSFARTSDLLCAHHLYQGPNTNFLISSVTLVADT